MTQAPHRRSSLAAVVTAALLAGTAGRANAADAPVPDDVVFDRDVEYANPDGQHLQLNIARPKAAIKGGQGRPTILCIHGGGFRAGSRDGYNGLIVKLAQRGYVAATASYRLAPKYQFPAAVLDTKAAVRWLRKNARKYGIDAEHIGVTGGSAGGHLAQFLGLTADVKRFEGSDNPGLPTRVQAVVNYFGPSDFTKSYDASVDAAQVLPLWLGGDLKTVFRRHIESSPLYWVTPDAAPTLLVHGTKDTYVAYEQALWLHDRLKTAQADVELVLLEGAGHGFKGDDAQRAEQAMFAFFDKHLKRP